MSSLMTNPSGSSTQTTAARLSGVTVAADATMEDSGLHDVSLQITSGTLTLISGARRDGTRTLLHVLAGQVSIAQGRAEIAGRSSVDAGVVPLRDPAVARRRVGLVPRYPALFSYLTVEANVAIAARLARRRAKATRSQVANLCRAVGLDSDRERLPKDLSWEGRQLVALGQALAHDPDLVLVEGAEGENQGSTHLVEVMIDLVHLDGRTIVTTVTSAPLVEVADQIIRLRSGRVAGGTW